LRIPVIEMESSVPRIRIRRLASFGLTTQNARQLSEFYENVLNFRLLGTARRSGPDFERLMGTVGGACAVTLGLGDDIIELLQFDRPGRPYPAGAASSDPSFQHFAIVVPEMHPAYQKLLTAGGWTAISTEGPQRLPSSSGGVTAFKFRDPEGHPLELLAFPDGRMPAHWRRRPQGELFLGIDHSAIGATDSAVSIAFYQRLGLRVAARSLNTGPEQDRLDAVEASRVEVTALEPEQATPHLELLSYRSAPRPAATLRSEDSAATRLVFETNGPPADGAMTLQGLIDPDGHHLVISAPLNAGSSTVANNGLPPRSAQPE
jgi:catechol 2,3-dioxygenase-like lactoylglutathione lyase family enzyme